MKYNEAIKVWNSGKKHELLNKFYPQFTYNSNKIENPDIMWSDVEHIFKGEAVRRFRVNDIIIKFWNTLIK